MKQLLCFVLLLVLAPKTLAGTVQPGRVELPVTDRGAEQRGEALTEGLRRVLVRLTGMREPQQLPAVAALLEADPSRWVLQYSYAERQPEPDTVSPSGEQAGEGGEPELLLSATFDVSGLSRRLAETGAPVWGTDRPPVLFWVVDQGPGAGSFIGRDERGELVEQLRETARERGLPVILPRLDAADRQRVRPADVRGLFHDPVMAASQAYDASLVVTAVLYQGGDTHLRWRLFEHGRQVRDGDIIQAAPPALLAELVHRVSDYVADLYAVRGGAGRPVTLQVHRLPDLADWKRAHDHLAGLSGMRGLHIERLEGTTVTFAGQFAGSLEQLDRLVRLEPALSHCPVSAADSPDPQGRSETDGDGAVQLEFCWSHGD